MKIKYDLTWGESVAVRQAFMDSLKAKPIVIDRQTLMGYGYPKHEGDERLVAMTRKIIERQTGLKPKHVILTNGATGGVVCALRAYFHHGFEYCLTDEPPYFPLYPDMINNSGLIHLNKNYARVQASAPVFLLDSPSNPGGTIYSVTKIQPRLIPVVWDAVYHSKVYLNHLPKPPEHDVMVGSYSKLTGINGIRVGWIATDDDAIADTINKIVTAEYIGLSAASTQVLLEILDNFDWEAFEKKAYMNLLDNKMEWSRVTKYFDNKEVLAPGMFYYTKLDTSAKYLLEKAGVLYMSGTSCGTTKDFGRFNLGQDCTLIKQAVKAILKSDIIFTL